MSTVKALTIPIEWVLEIITTYKNIKQVSNFRESVHVEYHQLNEKISITKAFLLDSRLKPFERDLLQRALLFLYLKQRKKINEAEDGLRQLERAFSSQKSGSFI